MKQDITFLESENMRVSYLESTQTAICTAKSRFIPEKEFKEVFTKTSDLILKRKIKKLVFDKRALKVFDQNSMTWYHVKWKVDMLVYGLKVHRKILPNDKLFAKSVEIGKERIKRENPEFSFSDFDIQYFDNLEDAIAK